MWYNDRGPKPRQLRGPIVSGGVSYGNYQYQNAAVMRQHLVDACSQTRATNAVQVRCGSAPRSGARRGTRTIMSELEKIKKGLHKVTNGEGPVLFEDPDFPASQNSVFYHQTPPFKFTWLRPKASTRSIHLSYITIRHGLCRALRFIHV
ncbi:hypothetical protein HPB48_009205 [Haemaphysalis longicornis]|uniref:Calpain catalytic domain-containing protein n=1 Tax=Haemaphysalis longicornis TaxID=44386 RepID=A0A9J6G8J4_HAELO|nr:hypothetical protein HPB48_009205 [Haemaphysalis longicornis]